MIYLISSSLGNTCKSTVVLSWYLSLRLRVALDNGVRAFLVGNRFNNTLESKLLLLDGKSNSFYYVNGVVDSFLLKFIVFFIFY